MKIALLLHFYQPYNQQEDILARIVNESYLPLTEGLLVRPRAKLTVNITSSLVELLLNTGHSRVVENIKTLAQRGQIELTGSAKYHAFLPLLPETEAIRQIEQNQEANEKIFGPACCNKVGFFTPEMAVSNEILSIVAKEGYTWMSVPQVAFMGGVPSAQKIYEDEKTGVKLFFRNKRVSSLILSGVCRSAEDLIKETRDIHDDIYWFTVMDAETFGHHRIGHEKFLFEIMDNAFFEPVTVSDLLSTSLEVVRTSIRPSTWTNEEQDFWLDREKTQFSSAKSFILWKDPENPIHALQWELTNYAINEVNSA
ncbi:MAG: Alpha-amylase, partial [uncultured bacterium]